MSKKLYVALFLIMFFAIIISGCSTDSETPIMRENNTINDTIRDAYTFTFPLVIMDATLKYSTNTEKPQGGKAPINQLIHSRRLANADDRTVVTPNIDTLYTQAYFDLSKDAMVFYKPKTDRFCSVEMIDAYTNCRHILGTGGDTEDERSYLVTGPDFTGEVPEGLKLISMPTNMGWMLVRTIINDKSDYENVYTIQDSMKLVPLSAYLENGFNYTPPSGIYDIRYEYEPLRHVQNMSPQDYFNTANKLMLANPPAAEDAKIVARMKKIGVGPGLTFNQSILGPNGLQKWKDMLAGLTNWLTSESKEFLKQMGIWVLYGEPIAEFGDEYEYRALIAIAALGANPISVAIYPKATTDDNGAVLNGTNSYRIHFEKDALPPVKTNGFWSITAYGEDNFPIDNEIDRYLINDRSKVKYNDDGSLDIILQQQPPQGGEMFENWLPVKDNFHLHLRIYLPKEEVLNDTWKTPSIIRD